MVEDNRQKIKSISSLTNKLGSQSELSIIAASDIDKFLLLTKGQQLQSYALKLIQRLIALENNAVKRLKWWFLVHMSINEGIEPRNVSQVIDFIAEQQSILRQQLQETDKDQKYLESSVELPYLHYLLRMTVCSGTQLTDETDMLDYGFILQNRLKQILKLQPIFQHYACYYPHHHYALNMFEACLLSIKIFWKQVCTTVKEVTLECQETQKIMKEECLFLAQSESLQERLREFVYDGHFCSSVRKSLILKHVRLIKDDIRLLESARRKTETEKEVISQLTEKRSTRSKATSTQPHERQEIRVSNIKNKREEKLTTDEKLQVLETIEQMEAILIL